MSNTINTGLANLSVSPLTGNRMNKGSEPGTWFEALANSWGQTLDKQATRIEAMSNEIGNNGSDNPSQITKLTAESMRMSFMANSSSSSIDSVGKALETMARKN
jgi:hypothetical protein